MKGIACICLFAVVATALARPHEDGEKYTDKYDNTDIDEILGSDRLLKGYTECLTGKGKCTSEGKELKNRIPDALSNDCAKCNEKQKEAIDKVIGHLINHVPEAWKELCEKYDPENKYAHKHEERLKKFEKKA